MSPLFQIHIVFVVASMIVFTLATRIIYKNSIAAFIGYAIIIGTTVGSVLTYVYMAVAWNNRLLPAVVPGGFFLALAAYYIGLMQYIYTRVKECGLFSNMINTGKNNIGWNRSCLG